MSLMVESVTVMVPPLLLKIPPPCKGALLALMVESVTVMVAPMLLSIPPPVALVEPPVTVTLSSLTRKEAESVKALPEPLASSTL